MALIRASWGGVTLVSCGLTVGHEEVRGFSERAVSCQGRGTNPHAVVPMVHQRQLRAARLEVGWPRHTHCAVLRVSNLLVEHLVQDDETVGGLGCVPFDEHRGRLPVHDLMGHRTRDVVCFLLWHRPGADVGRHAAALQVRRMVAGHDLDLVAGEVVQIGDDRRLFGKHPQLHLRSLVLVVLRCGGGGAEGKVGDRGKEERSLGGVGDSH